MNGGGHAWDLEGSGSFGFFSRIAILIGLLAGGVVAAIFGKINFAPVSEAQGFAISTPFHFGAPTFEEANGDNAQPKMTTARRG